MKLKYEDLLQSFKILKKEIEKEHDLFNINNSYIFTLYKFFNDIRYKEFIKESENADFWKSSYLEFNEGNNHFLSFIFGHDLKKNDAFIESLKNMINKQTKKSSIKNIHHQCGLLYLFVKIFPGNTTVIKTIDDILNYEFNEQDFHDIIPLSLTILSLMEFDRVKYKNNINELSLILKKMLELKVKISKSNMAKISDLIYIYMEIYYAISVFILLDNSYKNIIDSLINYIIESRNQDNLWKTTDKIQITIYYNTVFALLSLVKYVQISA